MSRDDDPDAVRKVSVGFQSPLIHALLPSWRYPNGVLTITLPKVEAAKAQLVKD